MFIYRLLSDWRARGEFVDSCKHLEHGLSNHILYLWVFKI